MRLSKLGRLLPLFATALIAAGALADPADDKAPGVKPDAPIETAPTDAEPLEAAPIAPAPARKKAANEAGAAPLVDATAALGVWNGQYVCNQGLTGLTLLVTEAEPEIKAVFVFYEAMSNPGVPDGCFEMSGGYDPVSGQLDLLAGRWLHQPRDYLTVDLEGRIDPETGIYTGSVRGWNCTNFEVVQGDAPSDREHICYAAVASNARSDTVLASE